MKRLLTILAASAVCLAAGLVACSSTKGSADVIVRTVRVEGKFKEIKTRNGLVVNYKVDPGAKAVTARISGPREFNERVKVTVKDKELIFTTKDGRGFNMPKGGTGIIINANGPAAYELDANSASILNMLSPLQTKGKLVLDASSGATINATGKISANLLSIDCSSGSIVNVNSTAKTETLSIDLSSGAVASVKADCSSAAIDLSSGAVVNLIGTATNAAADISSGAVVNAKQFSVSDRFTVDASSGSIVNCNARKLVADKSSGAIINNDYSK